MLKQGECRLRELKSINEENQRMINVPVGVLKAALSEINMQKSESGETFLTRSVVSSLSEILRGAGVRGV